MQNQMYDILIKEFTENYMEKLFYFCLKKTGGTDEAEELTQEISLNIFSALNKGSVPTNFSAWVWKIARNRYSMWATKKHIRNESVTGSDIEDYEIEDKKTSILDEMIHKEQLSLLRRELAFIKSDYRNILVAYYIENRPIREIAQSLSLSETTVKQRLHRARSILKEGMDMTREFGKRSYNPENITFAASGSQPSGLPWKAVQRSIPQNILLQASNNPSTVEELSIELGIALPYMEEEVELLYKATLLEKQGNRYITNFFILDKDCRIEVYNALRSGAKERSRLLKEFIEENLPDIRNLGIAGDHISDNAIRWWLIPNLIDFLIDSFGDRENFCNPSVRANGETWGFVGYELVDLPEKIMMSHNGSGSGENQFWAYKYLEYQSKLEQYDEPGYEETLLMCDCVRNGYDIPSLSENDKRIWKNIDGKFAHLSDEGKIIPDILVFENGNLEKIHQIFQEHKNYKLLIQNTTDAYKKVEEIFKKHNNKILHDNIGYNVIMELCAMRMMSIHDLADDNFLQFPEDKSKSTLGMWLSLK